MVKVVETVFVVASKEPVLNASAVLAAVALNVTVYVVSAFSGALILNSASPVIALIDPLLVLLLL